MPMFGAINQCYYFYIAAAQATRNGTISPLQWLHVIIFHELISADATDVKDQE